MKQELLSSTIGEYRIASLIDMMYCFNFMNKAGERIGKLSWDTGILVFEGEALESAKLFFLFLKPYIDSYIGAKR